MRQGQLYSVKVKKHRIKKGRLIFLLALCGFILLIIFSIRFLESLNSIQDTSSWSVNLPKPAKDANENILLFAVSDLEKEAIVTEVVLASYYPDNKNFRAIHMPVNTLIDIEEDTIPLRDIYRQGDRQLLVSTVANFFDVPIHYYIEINEDNLPRIVDMVGSVDLSTEKTMGNGSDVLSLIYEKGLSTAERMESRRVILTALASNIAQGNLWQKLKYSNTMTLLITTNFSWRNLFMMVDSLKNINYEENVKVIHLPGKEKVLSEGNYWQADKKQIPVLASWLGEDFSSVIRSEITVEVLNGCGIKGVAGAVAENLKNEGFNVVRLENADRFNYTLSQVISRIPDLDGAKDVAVLIPGSELRKDEMTESDVMVTVIVGKDYHIGEESD